MDNPTADTNEANASVDAKLRDNRKIGDLFVHFKYPINTKAKFSEIPTKQLISKIGHKYLYK